MAGSLREDETEDTVPALKKLTILGEKMTTIPTFVQHVSFQSAFIISLNLLLLLLLFFFLVFLELHLWHMEVPSLGV